MGARYEVSISRRLRDFHSDSFIAPHPCGWHFLNDSPSAKESVQPGVSRRMSEIEFSP